MKSILGTIAKDWATGSEIKSKSQFDVNNLIGDLFSVATSQFQRAFLYGIDMYIMHKGNPKQMSVYLDSKRQTLLWISSKTKAFLVDLYLSAVFIKRQTIQSGANQTQRYYMVLRQLEEEVKFVFNNAQDQKYYFHLFSSYINSLKIRNPNYSIYFSNINKIHAHYSTKNGTTNISEQEILEISKTVGLSNTRENAQILQACMKFHEVSNKKDIPLKCFDDYFSIQFCNSEIQPIFQKLSQEKVGDVKKNPRAILRKIMSPAQFQSFLLQCQKQRKAEVKRILKKYPGDLSFYDFSRYLYDNQLNNASRIQETLLNYPLKDYYCYSSHNTYLSGNQLTSDSQVERYSEDLENGIKCVQLDIHDDSSKPMVNHAFKSFSFCKPIDFEDVIKVIRAYCDQCDAQKKTHYPVILSLQNHASFENRQFMLAIITKHFGNKLFKLEKEQDFPTLQYLMGKILIKTNSSEQQIRLFKKKAIGKILSLDGSLQFDFNRNQQARFKSPTLSNSYQKFNQLKFKMQKEKHYFNSWFESNEQTLFAIVKEMTKITSIFKSRQGIKGQKLSQFGCTSLTNTSTIEAFNKNPQKIINYTRTSWLRTYPHGTQVSSYNYDPAQMLAVGAQIIALNTQTKDQFAWMMHGYFCGGYCPNPAMRGYVLKPSKLRLPNQLADQNKNSRLKIKIIDSGGQTVQMKFLGMPSDNKLNQNSTDQFSFSSPDEGFIMFNIGTKYRNCLAIRWILQGYRVIEGKAIESYIDCGKRILIQIIKQ